MSAPSLMTPAEVAAELRMSVDALRKQRSRGQGPAYVQFGRRIRYPRAAVLDYLRSNTVLTNDAAPPRKTVPPARKTPAPSKEGAPPRMTVPRRPVPHTRTPASATAARTTTTEASRPTRADRDRG